MSDKTKHAAFQLLDGKIDIHELSEGDYKSLDYVIDSLRRVFIRVETGKYQQIDLERLNEELKKASKRGFKN